MEELAQHHRPDVIFIKVREIARPCGAVPGCLLHVGELARIAGGVTGERGRERGGGGGGRRAVPAHLPRLQERCESEWADVLDQNRLCGFPTSCTHRRKYTPTSRHWQIESR